jgi:hypothetical protein
MRIPDGSHYSCSQLLYPSTTLDIKLDVIKNVNVHVNDYINTEEQS